MNEETQPLDPTSFRCATCHEVRSEKEVTKLALDFIKNEDGTLSPGTLRFSVFCSTCQKFLGVIDPDATAQLDKMTEPKF